jgi:hypothetical protein
MLKTRDCLNTHARIVFIVITTVVFLVFSGLLPSSDTYAKSKRICSSAGIGDSKATFNKDYGKGKGDSEMMRYKRDYILPMFLSNAAWNILLQFEATNKPVRSKKSAKKAYRHMIPSDAKKVRQYHDQGGERLIIIYQSKKLAKSIKKSVFMGDKPGSFMAILHRNSKGYFSVTLATGNSNP